jgi:HEAT repeat protein
MKDLLADLTSGDDPRAENAIPAIVAKGMDAIPALLELTKADSADSRWWAVRALSASPHTRTGDLIPLLDDPAPEVRAATALALCEHPDESAVPALIKTLKDEDAIAAGLAGNALVKIGNASVAGLLDVMNARVEPGRNEAQVHARILALRALAEIRDPRAIPVMMKSMSEESAVLQYWAQEGLERLGLDMVYMRP